MKNILFICSENINRSKTAEKYFSEIFPKLNFTSAGTNLEGCKKRNTQALEESLLKSAEIAFVMENKHFEQIASNKIGEKYTKKITILNIPDIYNVSKEEDKKALIQVLRDKLIPLLEIM